jgi:hexosaminidase
VPAPKGRRRNWIATTMSLSMCAGCANWSSLTNSARPAPFADARPLTIPAVRFWCAGTGAFSLTNISRILISAADSDALGDTAALFAAELKSLTGLTVAIIVSSTPDPQAGGIQLSIRATDPELGSEGYELKVGTHIDIHAQTAAGAFYASRTLLQLFHQKLFNDAFTAPAGVIRDWPKYSERGLMVDIARKHFSLDWLEQQVRKIAYLKMNYLHLHIADNEGFGIESRHSGFVSPRGGTLTKAEVRHLVALSTRYHVSVVPEIDMPGHMKAVLHDPKYRKYRLRNVLGVSNDEVLDITNAGAVSFAMELIDEYRELFPGVYWHMGADEVLPPWSIWLYPQLKWYASQKYSASATAEDAIHYFINEIDGYVQQATPATERRTLRVWNDQLGGGTPQSTVRFDVVVDWWTNFSLLSEWHPLTPQQIVEAGHHIMNSGWWPTYYDTGGFFRPANPGMKSAYEHWSVEQFEGPIYLNPERPLLPPQTLPPGSLLNLGTKLSLWNDHPNFRHETAIAREIAIPLHVIAEKGWGSPLLALRFSEFRQNIGTIGDAPRE